MNRPRLSLFSAMLGATAIAACHGRPSPASEPQTAAGTGNSPESPSKSFRLSANGGIGFDDLLFSPELHAVLAPAGGMGCVELFDASSLARSSVCGIGPGGNYAGGHGEGTTSADVGAGLLFAVDRSSQRLHVVDPGAKRVVSSTPLAGEPDYVRWVAPRREVWVTEPDREQIEVFNLMSDNPPKLSLAGTIAVKGGPESLVIDSAHDRAFTHLWEGRSVTIALSTRVVSSSFENGCKGSRGIALDVSRGQLFAGCAEGKAVVLDVAHDNALLSSLETPSGVDIIAVDLALRHLYLPASSDGTVTVLGVGNQGKLSRLGAWQAAKGAHCVASDDQHHVWVCAPESGSLLVYDDSFTPAGE